MINRSLRPMLSRPTASEPAFLNLTNGHGTLPITRASSCHQMRAMAVLAGSQTRISICQPERGPAFQIKSNRSTA